MTPTVAGLTILREVRGTGGKWLVALCACGNEWHMNAETRRKHEQAGTVASCKPCRSRAQAARGVAAGGFGGKHYRGRRAGVPESSGRHCPKCYGLSWQRSFPHCSGCGEAFAEEPAVTIADVMAQPRDEARTMPWGGPR